MNFLSGEGSSKRLGPYLRVTQFASYPIASNNVGNSSKWTNRSKPISAAFRGPEAPEYVAALLAPERVAAAGFFNPVAVSRLLAKCRSGAPLRENDDMALVGVLSTQLWHEELVAPRAYPEETSEPRVRLTEALEPAA